MNYLFWIASLSIVPPLQTQTLPDSFYQLPEQIRERATIVVSATYGQGRTPCMLRPDGTRVWGLDSWFKVETVYRGKLGSKTIRINRQLLPTSTYVVSELRTDRKYLVLLRPSDEKASKIKTKNGLTFWDALRDEEIVSILEAP